MYINVDHPGCQNKGPCTIYYIIYNLLGNKNILTLLVIIEILCFPPLLGEMTSQWGER